MKQSKDPIWDEPLAADEFARREATALRALDGPEGDEMRELRRWFCRRYPTPLARLRYARKQLASIRATQEKIVRTKG